MHNPDDIMDVMHRIHVATDQRCGDGKWKPANPMWPEVMKACWPDMYFLAPSKVPDGWCDIMLAFSDHLVEIAPGAKVTDAFEDTVHGGLSLKVALPRDADTDAIYRVVSAYEHVASTQCRVCGAHTEVTVTGVGKLRRAKVVCEEHA